jgi:replication factor C subunit 2/4
METLPWIEKYRPNTFDEIVYQKHIIESIKGLIENNSFPNLIFYGPPGCGKTSMIHVIAKEIFKDEYNDKVIELNASDERGINVIRDKIKINAQLNSVSNKSNYNFKLIILDEADTITLDSQFALRRIMEKYTRTARFCLICNYINRIIDPILSRCSKFRFNQLPNKYLKEKILNITTNEKIQINNDMIDTVLKFSNGDLRKTINSIQRLHNLFGEINSIESILGYLSDDMVNQYINILKTKDFNQINNYINNIINQGYSVIFLIDKLFKYFIESQYPDYIKAKIILEIKECDFYLKNNCDEFIQFLKISCFISTLL